MLNSFAMPLPIKLINLHREKNRIKQRHRRREEAEVERQTQRECNPLQAHKAGHLWQGHPAVTTQHDVCVAVELLAWHYLKERWALWGWQLLYLHYAKPSAHAHTPVTNPPLVLAVPLQYSYE